MDLCGFAGLEVPFHNHVIISVVEKESDSMSLLEVLTQ